MIRDCNELTHCEAIAAFGLPDPASLAADPSFPSRDLLNELRAAYVREAHREQDMDSIARLWVNALRIWRRHYADETPRKVRHELNQVRLGGAA